MTFTARIGAHDDLVLAVAIALWHTEQRARRGIMVPESDGTPGDEAEY
jgi:hypothetical protein